MITHAAFFQALGELAPDEPLWHSTFAGLSVLRLVDAFSADASRAASTESMTIQATRRALSEIAEGDPSRAILGRVLDTLDDQKRLSSNIGEDLTNYGRSLDLEGRWSLAADVFQTVSESFAPSENADLVIEASTLLGAAARNTGDWYVSDRGYAKAQHIADTTGNKQLSLKVRVGVAGSHMLHGNLPAAELELDDVLAEAKASQFDQIEALALHGQASVAHSRGEYQRAVHLAYRSLELTTSRTARDRILADIAAAYAGLGMRETARDGYLIVALTSPHQWVRWQATVNLMELAVDESDEIGFDDCYSQLQSARLDPRLRSYFLYYSGLGFRRFGRDGFAEQLNSARDFASQHQLHQLAHEIEQAIEQGDLVPQVDPALPSDDRSGELQRIAEALLRLRENAVTEAG